MRRTAVVSERPASDRAAEQALPGELTPAEGHDAEWIDITSLRDALKEIRDVHDRLNQLWSDALKTVEADRARQAQAQLFETMLQMLVRRVQALNSRLTKLGVSTIGEALPLDVAALSRLQARPDPRLRIRQLQVASLYATSSLAEAINAFATGGGFRIKVGGVDRSVWEAGAFSLLVQRADLLVRVEEAIDEALIRATSSSEPSQFQQDLSDQGWFQMSQRASLLVSQGFPEAALPFILRAARSLIASRLGVQHAQLPPSVAPLLAACSATAGIASAFSTLEDACQQLGLGQDVDLGVAVPLGMALTVPLQSALLAADQEELIAAANRTTVTG